MRVERRWKKKKWSRKLEAPLEKRNVVNHKDAVASSGKCASGKHALLELDVIAVI